MVKLGDPQDLEGVRVGTVPKVLCVLLEQDPHRRDPVILWL